MSNKSDVELAPFPPPAEAPLVEPEGRGSYLAPQVYDIGRVRELTLGSSSSGNADANSQYYW